MSLRERANAYTRVGVEGRRTGLQVPEGNRDSEGFEELDAFFPSSSPANRTVSQVQSMEVSPAVGRAPRSREKMIS